MKNTKFTIFNYAPYEYKFLEEYLEDMALKGWKLKSLTGAFFKFNKIKPSKIKYSVDIMDKVTFFDGKNSEEVLNYREYCKAAGWDFVCENGKVQVYSSEDEIEKIPIHTEQEEKFKSIFRASLKHHFLNIFNAIILLAMQYMMVFGSGSPIFLAHNSNLIAILIVILFAIQEIAGVINFIFWAVKGKKKLNENKEPSYSNFYFIKFKKLMNNLILILGVILLISLLGQGETLVINILVVNLVIILAIYGTINFVSKTNYVTKKKRKINIAAYIIIFILGIVLMNFSVFRGMSLGGDSNRSDKSNIKLTLEDFNDRSKSEDEVYIHNQKGVLASNLYYSDTGENISIGYQLFESKYEFVINYFYSRLIDQYKEWDVEYIEIVTKLPSNIKVYTNDGKYLFVSDKKILEFNKYDINIDESELINIVYENIFQ